MGERLQAEGSLDIGGFFKLVKMTWDLTQEGRERPVQMHQAFPVNIEMNETDPVITYSIADKSPMQEMKELKPRMRHIFEDPKDVTRKVGVYGQRFDYIVAFEVWSDLNQEADAIADELEEFMFVYTGLFKRKGVVDVWFQRSSSGHISSMVPQYLENKRSRTLTYRVTIETLRQFDISTVESITLKILGMN
jgi:hypothetical protein